MTKQAQPLSSVIGAELRTLREAGGLRQEQLAAEARRRFGLPWTRATVAAIELGRRQVSIGELLLLPQILGQAGAGWGYAVRDFVPDDDRPVLVAGGAVAPARVVRTWLPETAGESIATPKPRSTAPPFTLPRTWLIAMLRVKRLEDVPERFWFDVALESAGDAEQKSAASLGVQPLALALAARHAWARSLTAERDQRVNATASAVERDPTAPADPEWPRRLQAIRGHVTRELLAQLRPLLKDVTKKKRGRA